MFCSAYSVPERLHPSVSSSTELDNGDRASCGTALVWASCVGDNPSGHVLSSDNDDSGPTIGLIVTLAIRVIRLLGGQATLISDALSLCRSDKLRLPQGSWCNDMMKLKLSQTANGHLWHSLSSGCPTGLVWGDGSNGHPSPPRQNHPSGTLFV